MVLRGMLGWIAGGSQNGLFSWFIKICEQKAQTRRAAGWLAHTKELPDRVPEGTYYKETTPDGSVEIWKAKAQSTHFSVIVDNQEPQCNPRKSPEVQAQQPRALGQEDMPFVPDGLS